MSSDTSPMAWGLPRPPWVCVLTRSRGSAHTLPNPRPQHGGPRELPGNLPLGRASIWMTFQALLTLGSAVVTPKSLPLGPLVLQKL